MSEPKFVAYSHASGSEQNSVTTTQPMPRSNGTSNTKVISAKWQLLPQSILSITLDYLQARDTRLSSNRAELEIRFDLMSVQCACRTWFVEAQKRLYQNIQVHDNESSPKSGRENKILGRSIVLLRRTLRKRPMLAMLVKHIHINVLMQSGASMTKAGHIIPALYPDLLASLVMACPNLEKLTGVQPLYTHEFDKLIHALATRTGLKQYSWLIGENRAVTARARSQRPPGILDHEQTSEFLSFHSQWSNLETLQLTSFGGKGIVEQTVLTQALNMLPSLKHLIINRMDADDFTNKSLADLPPLESLNLEKCIGVTDMGLCRWVQGPTAKNIRGLSLIHQNLVSLLTISTILARLEKLENFHISQDIELSLPLALPVRQPLLSSKSLSRMRWEVSSPQFAAESTRISQSESGVVEHAKHPKSSEPSMSSQHLILSLLNHGLPRCHSLRLGPHQTFSELTKWAYSSNAPKFSSPPTRLPYILVKQSRTAVPKQYTTSTKSYVNARTPLFVEHVPVELEAHRNTHSSVKPSLTERTLSFQQRYHGPQRTLTQRGRFDSLRKANTTSTGSTSSEQSIATNSSTVTKRTASTTASISTKASSVSGKSPSTLRPIGRAEDRTMGFEFGFRNGTQLPPLPNFTTGKSSPSTKRLPVKLMTKSLDDLRSKAGYSRVKNEMCRGYSHGGDNKHIYDNSFPNNHNSSPGQHENRYILTSSTTTEVNNHKPQSSPSKTSNTAQPSIVITDTTNTILAADSNQDAPVAKEQQYPPLPRFSFELNNIKSDNTNEIINPYQNDKHNDGNNNTNLIKQNSANYPPIQNINTNDDDNSTNTTVNQTYSIDSSSHFSTTTITNVHNRSLLQPLSSSSSSSSPSGTKPTRRLKERYSFESGASLKFVHLIS